MDEIAAAVYAVIEEEFGLPPGSVDEQTTALDIDGWDSLRHATLLILVERRLGIEFKAADILDLENVGGLIEAGRRHVKNA